MQIDLFSREGIIMDEIKGNILFAAFKLFLVKGYREVSLNDIAEEVNLTKGSLYHHFSTKEEIFSKVVDIYFFDMVNKFKKVAMVNNLSPILKISYLFKGYTGFIDDIVGYVGNEENIYGYYLLMFEATRNIEGFKEKMKGIYADILSGITRMITEGINKGSFRQDIEANVMSLHIFSVLEGLNIMSIYNEKIDYHDYFLKLENQITDMLKK